MSSSVPTGRHQRPIARRQKGIEAMLRPILAPLRLLLLSALLLSRPASCGKVLPRTWAAA